MSLSLYGTLHQRRMGNFVQQRHMLAYDRLLCSTMHFAKWQMIIRSTTHLQPMDKMDEIVDIAITENRVIVYNSKYWRAFDMNGQVST